jgi:hypothetical protein
MGVCLMAHNGLQIGLVFRRFNIKINKMARIKVTITIPDYEYENWNDFQDGIEEMMANLKAEIREDLKSRFIKSFEVESEHED